jgi:hypothetical protein
MLGLLGTMYFFLIFDTSVYVPTEEIFGRTVGGGYVNNLGLMNDRTNGIIICMGFAFIGFLVAVFSRKKAKK